MNDYLQTQGNSSVPQVLTEALRKQYLEAMGIQTWYDPELPALESPPVAEISTALAPSIAPVSEAPAEAKSATLVLQDNAPVTVTEVAPSVAQEDSTDDINQAILNCTACELHASRPQALPGQGDTHARLMLIVHAPGHQAGQDVILETVEMKMLEAMLKAIGESVSSVFITSLVKCRPPQDRAPYTSELICCDDHLTAQIKQIQPRAIMLLGEQVSQQLLVSQKGLMDLRLRHHQHLGVPVFASYHPAELINSADNKRKVWQDLLQIKKQLEK